VLFVVAAGILFAAVVLPRLASGAG
jgi:hypothetical protein